MTTHDAVPPEPDEWIRRLGALLGGASPSATDQPAFTSSRHAIRCSTGPRS